jgi:hypothetical protein
VSADCRHCSASLPMRMPGRAAAREPTAPGTVVRSRGWTPGLVSRSRAPAKRRATNSAARPGSRMVGLSPPSASIESRARRGSLQASSNPVVGVLTPLLLADPQACLRGRLEEGGFCADDLLLLASGTMSQVGSARAGRVSGTSRNAAPAPENSRMSRAIGRQYATLKPATIRLEEILPYLSPAVSQ